MMPNHNPFCLFLLYCFIAALVSLSLDTHTRQQSFINDYAKEHFLNVVGTSHRAIHDRSKNSVDQRLDVIGSPAKCHCDLESRRVTAQYVSTVISKLQEQPKVSYQS
jgi:hypothetical protein